MELKKPFKYFAVRVSNTIVFRRTVKTITRVKSTLYRPNTTFALAQVSYTGGKVVGTMPYTNWVSHGGKRIDMSGCLQITRDQFRALSPFIQKGE